MKIKTHLLTLVVQSSNKAFILLLFIASLYSISVSAQDCSTPDIPIEEMQKLPWYGNPDYLPSFMDSVRNIEGI